MVHSIGILTFETVPGLNSHFRNALTADLSRVGSPVLCSIEAPVTLPLAGSTDTMQTPIPVTPGERALAGYLGRGVKVARDFWGTYDLGCLPWRNFPPLRLWRRRRCCFFDRLLCNLYGRSWSCRLLLR